MMKTMNDDERQGTSRIRAEEAETAAVISPVISRRRRSEIAVRMPTTRRPAPSRRLLLIRRKDTTRRRCSNFQKHLHALLLLLVSLLSLTLHGTRSFSSCAVSAFIITPSSSSSSLSLSSSFSHKKQLPSPAVSPFTSHSKRSRTMFLQAAVVTDAEFASSSSKDFGKNKKNKNNNPHQHPKQEKQKKTLSPSQLERRIVNLGRQGQTDQALKVFSSIDRPTIRQVNAAIDACARARPVQVERAFDILHKSCRGGGDENDADDKNKNQNQNHLPQPNVYTFGSLMSACARAGRVDLAVDLLDTMQQEPYSVEPNAVVYNTAVSACDKCHPPQPQTALRLLQEATQERGLRMSVVGYNAALSAYARAGDTQGAVQLLERMEEQQQQSSSQDGGSSSAVAIPRPDAVTYGTILSAFERAEEWNSLMQYAAKIKKISNIRLDGLALTSILHACQRLGLAQDALYYLNQMKTAIPPARRSTAGWQVAGHRAPLQGPDAVAYLLAISASARGGAWTQGMELLDEYLEQQQNTTTSSSQQQQKKHAVALYTAAISGCEYAGEWQAAFGLLDRMRQQGVQPNQVTFATVMGACATACSKYMASKSSSSSSRKSRSTRLGGGDTGPPIPPLRQALRLLRVLHKTSSSSSSSSNSTGTAVASSSVVKPNIHIYNAAIRACAEACDLNRAFRLLDMLRTTSAAAATATSKDDDSDGNADSDNVLRPNIVTYGTLMTACERVGSIEGMNKVFRLLQQESDANLEKNEVIYGAAISCCRKTGQSERAMALLQKMMQEGLEPNVATFNTVLMAQTEAASKQANQRNRGGGNGKSSSSAGDARSTAKDIQRAVLVYKMLRSTKEAPSASPNRLTYNILIRFLSENMLPREAEGLLQEMRTRENLVPDVHLYTSVVSSYERTGQPLRALRLMESMNDDGYDFYEVKVLNAAFKRALKVANAVVGVGEKRGQEGTASTDLADWSYDKVDDDEDDDYSDGPTDVSDTDRRSNYNFLAGFNNKEI